MIGSYKIENKCWTGWRCIEMPNYKLDEYLPISGIRSFAVCRRKWALRYVEFQDCANQTMTESNLFYTKDYDALHTGPGNCFILRGLQIQSKRLGVRGICNAAEFCPDENGISLIGRSGTWSVLPLDYQETPSPLFHEADKLSLCLQAICLEEMLSCKIETGILYYGQARREESVAFSREIRTRVEKYVADMHAYRKRGYTPKAESSELCGSCSAFDVCLPELSENASASIYIHNTLFAAEEEMVSCEN